MPNSFSIGIGFREFWDMTPRELRLYQRCYRERQRYIDDMMYQGAQYAFYAHSVALGNFGLALSGKHKKPMVFSDVIKRNASVEEIPSGELTEQEKRRMTENLFTNLKLRMANFQIANGVGGN